MVWFPAAEQWEWWMCVGGSLLALATNVISGHRVPCDWKLKITLLAMDSVLDSSYHQLVIFFCVWKDVVYRIISPLNGTVIAAMLERAQQWLNSRFTEWGASGSSQTQLGLLMEFNGDTVCFCTVKRIYSEGCPPTKTSMEFLIATSGWSIVYTSCLKAGKCSCNHVFFLKKGSM